MEQLDIKTVIRQKYHGWLPPFLCSLVAKLIHQKELNEMNRLQQKTGGVEFADKVLAYLNVQVQPLGLTQLPQDMPPCIYVANHPLGGLDGVALISTLGHWHHGEIKVPATDLLLNISQMADILLPVNKFGRQGKEAQLQFEQALTNPNTQLIMFPAGFCSRYNERKEVRDRQWSPSFIRWARRYNRAIVPIYFDHVNSRLFYRLAWLRERLKAKFNYEQVLLPHEMIRAKGSNLKFKVGNPIMPADLPKDIHEDYNFAQRLRDSLYTL